MPFALGKRAQATPASVENRAGGQAEANEVIAILARQHQVVFPAVETAAEGWTTVVDGAPGRTEVNARAIAVGFEQMDGAAFRMVKANGSVGGDVVSHFRMQKESLAGAAAFGAPVAGNLSLGHGFHGKTATCLVSLLTCRPVQDGRSSRGLARARQGWR